MGGVVSHVVYGIWLPAVVCHILCASFARSWLRHDCLQTSVLSFKVHPSCADLLNFFDARLKRHCTSHCERISGRLLVSSEIVGQAPSGNSAILSEYVMRRTWYWRLSGQCSHYRPAQQACTVVFTGITSTKHTGTRFMLPNQVSGLRPYRNTNIPTSFQPPSRDEKEAKQSRKTHK